MILAARTSVLLFALLLSMACIRANGPGGGHGGSGGHGSGGHGSGGHASSGHGVGHAGHSSGHFSTRNASGHSFAHLHIFHHGPRHHHFAQPIAFAARRKRFGSFPCTNDVFFPRFSNGFGCFNNGFFLDSFFFGAFSMLGPLPDPAYASFSPDAGTYSEMSDSADTAPPSASGPQDQQPVTLLQLLDGSMYGLTSYRVVGHELRCTTTYGGQNSVPFNHIDFTQTLKLNADRNVPFVLEPESTPR